MSGWLAELKHLARAATDAWREERAERREHNLDRAKESLSIEQTRNATELDALVGKIEAEGRYRLADAGRIRASLGGRSSDGTDKPDTKGKRKTGRVA